MKISSTQLIDELHEQSSEERALKLKRYFKSDDIKEDWFLGLSMPAIRKTIVHYVALSFSEIEQLLTNEFHEIRMAGLLILAKKSNKKSREEVATFYLQHIEAVNAWDLVDASASEVLGLYIVEHQKNDILVELAMSKNRWHQRIALVASFAYIKKKNLEPALKISLLLCSSEQDLVQKANGWLLRHAINKGFKEEVLDFLLETKDQYHRKILTIAFQDLPKIERL